MAGKDVFGNKNENNFKHGDTLGLPPTSWHSPGAIPVPAEAISLAHKFKAFLSLCCTDIHKAASLGPGPGWAFAWKKI